MERGGTLALLIGFLVQGCAVGVGIGIGIEYDDMNCDHEQYPVYRVATTIRFEYAAVPIDPDADSDSDPEKEKDRTNASSRRLESGAAHAPRSASR